MMDKCHINRMQLIQIYTVLVHIIKSYYLSILLSHNIFINNVQLNVPFEVSSPNQAYLLLLLHKK